MTIDYIQAQKEFLAAFNQPTCTIQQIQDNEALAYMRARLIREEAQEVVEAVENVAASLEPDTENLLKELVDLAYVTFGAVVSLGFSGVFPEAYRRVHESNMSKLGPDGKPVYRSDGKVLKGPNYKPPVLTDLVNPEDIQFSPEEIQGMPWESCLPFVPDHIG